LTEGPAPDGELGRDDADSRQLAAYGLLPAGRRFDTITLWRYTEVMKTALRRATVYFNPAVHRALRLRAAETDRSVSDIINDAVGQSLLEDAEDLAAFEERTHEPSIRFADAVRDLRRRGRI